LIYCKSVMRGMKKKAIFSAVCAAAVTMMISGCFLPVPGFRGRDGEKKSVQTPRSRSSAPQRGKKGVYHTVRRGETIYRLSKMYGVSQNKIIGANHISDVTKVKEGERLFIPGANRVVDEPGRGNNGADGGRASPGKSHAPPPKTSAVCRVGAIDFIWPARGELTSGFGVRNGRQHDGIDISNRIGTPIHAAADGVVIYAGRLGGYGLIVILKHEGRFKTIYAHNRKILVKKGDTVRQGQVIAELGNSGNATGPHLHFEIRCGQEAVDPEPYLPKK